MSYSQRPVTGAKAPMATALEPRAEMETLQKREAQLLASTVKSLAEADQISTHTLSALNAQTEQLKRIQAETEAIDQNLNQSEYYLRGLKPWGWVKNLFRKEPPAAPERAPAGPSSSSSGRPASAGSSAPASKGAARLLANEARRKQEARAEAAATGGSKRGEQDAVDRAFDQIDGMLDGLKVKSSEINRTLQQHNEMLPEITQSVDKNQERINKQQAELKKRLAGR